MRVLFLRPLSLLWEVLYRMRRSFYEYGVFKKEYFKVPVISVGNITFGGTGKTPTIIWLSRYFEKLGLTAMVLTRGYKGSYEKGAGIIMGGQNFRSNPQAFGDEPLLIARNIQDGAVVVGRNRALNLKKYFNKVKPDVVLLDDGFQHLHLYRSLNIVLFDATLNLSMYYTAPYGYLREGWTALKDADIIFLTRCDQASEIQIDQLIHKIMVHIKPKTPIAKIKYESVGLYNCYDNLIYTLDEVKDKKVVVLSAIASTESFYNSLTSLGMEITEKFEYPDHYFFSTDDINKVVERATQADALIIATEKDIVKIKRVSQNPNILYMKIDLAFITGQEELDKKVKRVLSLDSI
jgi:tetraacyldisaccharide 4'-kinase